MQSKVTLQFEGGGKEEDLDDIDQWAVDHRYLSSVIRVKGIGHC